MPAIMCQRKKKDDEQPAHQAGAGIRKSSRAAPKNKDLRNSMPAATTKGPTIAPASDQISSREPGRRIRLGGPGLPTTMNSPPPSPTPPTVEPLSPVLGPQSSARTYTHNSQVPQTFIPQPKPQVIDFDSNPDAIALQAAISVLQIQRQNAMRDIKKLQEIKERAAADPDGFVEALKKGEVKSTKDKLFEPSYDSEEDSENEDEDEEQIETTTVEKKTTGDTKKRNPQGKETEVKKPWPMIPAPQSVVQVPNINWAQYGVMGESLDKLHADQVKNPNQGKPATIKPDGTVVPAEGGRRSESGPVARPVGMAEGIMKEKGRGGLYKK